MPESLPDRIERIKRDHNISWPEAHRVARAEIRLEDKLKVKREGAA